MDNQLTVNGHVVEFHEMDDAGRITFKLDKVWRDPMDFCIPNVTALEYVLRLHQLGNKAGFWSRELKATASNSEVRRWVEQGGVRFNGRILKVKDMLDFPLYSVVMFPKGNRITIL
jgi:hypothetical protein